MTSLNPPVNVSLAVNLNLFKNNYGFKNNTNFILKVPIIYIAFYLQNDFTTIFIMHTSYRMVMGSIK